MSMRLALPIVIVCCLWMPSVEGSSSSACPGLCVGSADCGQFYITTKQCFAVTIYGRSYCNLWDEPCDLLPLFTGKDELTRSSSLDFERKGIEARSCAGMDPEPSEKETRPEFRSLHVSRASEIPART